MILLDLPDTATPEQVKLRWRELAAEHHPDKGGDAATFSRLHDQYKQALKHAEALVALCPECHGAGRTTITTGLSTLKMRCKACGGKGRSNG